MEFKVETRRPEHLEDQAHLLSLPQRRPPDAALSYLSLALANPPTSQPNARENLKQLLAGVVDPAVIDRWSDAQVHALHSSDPTVVRALFEAGLSADDVEHLGGMVSHEDASQATFSATVKEGLRQGQAPENAVLGALYHDQASAPELTNSAFLTLLKEARRTFPQASRSEQAHWARAAQVHQALGANSPVSLDALLKLSDAALQGLNLADPQRLKDWLNAGAPLQALAQMQASSLKNLPSLSTQVMQALQQAGMRWEDIANFGGVLSDADLSAPFLASLKSHLTKGGSVREGSAAWEALQAARLDNLSVPAGVDPGVARALMATGMRTQDVAKWAPKFSPEDLTPEFLKAVKEHLAQHKSSGAQALVWARYGDRVSAQEYQNEAFLARVINALGEWRDARAAGAPELIDALKYLRDHVDVFEAAEKVPFSNSNAHNNWFSSGGVNQLAGMTEDSREWKAIEATLGRSLSREERKQAIDAAASVQKNWGLLSARASQLGLGTRPDGGLDFTKENLANADLSVLQGRDAQTSRHALGLIEALHFMREHVDLFEAAEKVLFTESNAHNGWFASGGVNQLAGMTENSSEWAQIEATLGRSVGMPERQQAIRSARSVQANWSMLWESAASLGLNRQDGGGLDFTQKNLDRLDLSSLVARLGWTYDDKGMSVMSALAYAKQNFEAFEAAEKVMFPDSDAGNGWFSSGGVNQLAGMSVNSADWGKIEATLGRVIDNNERRRLIGAAKGIQGNWALLQDRSQALGLDKRSDGTLDFTRESLGRLRHGALLDQMQGPLSTDLTQALQYARAQHINEQMHDGASPPASMDELLQLKTWMLENLMKMSGRAIKMLSQDFSLGDIGTLEAAQAERLSKMDPGTLRKLAASGASLSDIASLTDEDISAIQDAWKNGYRLAGKEETFNDIQSDSVKSLGSSQRLQQFETRDGQKVIVMAASNPGLFGKAQDLQWQAAAKKIDEIRHAHGLPPMNELDVMAMDTGEPIDPDDPAKGTHSVGSLALKALTEQYRGMLERGDMDEHDPRAQLLRAFEAKSALANGYDLLPYYEKQQLGGTYRTYPGGEDNPTYQKMSSQDVRELINEGRLDNRIQALLSRPEVAKDYQAALSQSVDKLGDKKQTLTDSLHKMLTGTEYLALLKDLRQAGLSDAAERMIQKDLGALAALDPAKAADAAQQLQLNSYSDEIKRLIDDPSLIDTDTMGKALLDAVAIAIQVLRSSSGLIRHSAQSTNDLIKYFNEVLQDKKSVNALAGVLKELVIQQKTKTGTVDLSRVSQADFDEAMAKSYVPMELRGKVSNFFATTQKYGVWGSVAGAAALASFGYKLSKGAWGPDSTAMQRWGAARDVISFLSVIGHQAKSVAGMLDLFSRTPDSALAWKALGLDRTLPQVWGKQSFLPGERPWAGPWGTPPPPPDSPRGSARVLQEMVDDYSRFWADYDTVSSRYFNAVPDLGSGSSRYFDAVSNLDDLSHLDDLSRQASSRLASIWATQAPTELARMPGLGTRLGVTMLKVLGTVTDLAGIADIVLGALALKKGLRDGDTGAIVSSSLAIGGGVGLTTAGAIGTASLFAAVPATAAAAVAPLFLAGAVLSVGAFVAGLVAASIKRHNQLQHATNVQSDWWKSLGEDGLLKGDWSEKLEFYRYAFAIYGNDNTDPSKSYLQSQRSEWEHFLSTPQRDGSSLNRLDASLHHSTPITWEPPREVADT